MLPEHLQPKSKYELLDEYFGDRYGTSEEKDQLFDLAEKLTEIFKEEKETPLINSLHRLFPETKNMYYGDTKVGDYDPKLDPYMDKIKDALYLIRILSNSSAQNKKLSEKLMKEKYK